MSRKFRREPLGEGTGDENAVALLTEGIQTMRERMTSIISQRPVNWVAALLLTYIAGKFAVDLAKWIVLAFLAPGAQAKLILATFLAGAALPVVLFGVPAFYSWRRLLRSGNRIETLVILVFELMFLAYVDIADVQYSLANFAN